MATLIAFRAFILSLYAAYVSEENFRSKLYNKRIAIYEATRGCYDVLLQWNNSSEHKIKKQMFITAVIESSLLFKGPVQNKLEEMRRQSDIITSQKELVSASGAGSTEAMKSYGPVPGALAYWNKSMNGELVELMREYLDFREASPVKVVMKRICKKMVLVLNCVS